LSRPAWLVWIAAALLAVALAAAGWSLASAPHAASAAGPARLVSLSPPITETLFAIGAADQLVARSDWCQSPAAAKALPPVGSALEPKLEAIVALHPTLILTEATLAGRTDQLTALAPTEVLPWLSLDDLVGSVHRLGELTGHQAQAAALATTLHDRLGVTPPADAPRVLVLLGLDGLARGEVWYVKRSSLHGVAMHAAGMRNAVDQDVSGAPNMSIEALLKADPDAIIAVLADATDPEVARQRTRDALAALPLRAVKAGAVGALAGPERFNTGPSVLDLADGLRDELARLPVSR
jgi:ABC-type Fe3+-hydroxamate transport system substrate-binding protein